MFKSTTLWLVLSSIGFMFLTGCNEMPYSGGSSSSIQHEDDSLLDEHR